MKRDQWFIFLKKITRVSIATKRYVYLFGLGSNMSHRQRTVTLPLLRAERANLTVKRSTGVSVRSPLSSNNQAPVWLKLIPHVRLNHVENALRTMIGSKSSTVTRKRHDSCVRIRPVDEHESGFFTGEKRSLRFHFDCSLIERVRILLTWVLSRLQKWSKVGEKMNRKYSSEQDRRVRLAFFLSQHHCKALSINCCLKTNN